MEDQLYYSTGKAAQELGASQDTVRALCNGGLVRAVPTNGGQWRIPAREIERLRREGLPPVPRPMPGDSPMTRNVSTRHRMNGDKDDDADPHRAAGQVPEVVQAYAGAARKHALIEEREADWRLQELEDRFRQREDEIQTRQRKRESETQRADWLREWEQVALSAFDQRAPGAPPQMRLDLHKAIRERLGSLNPIPTPQVTAELMAGIVKPFVERQREQEEAEKIIIEARDHGLPVDARAKPWAKELSQWQTKLLRTIGERLGDGDHPLDTIRAAVNQAVADVTREFEEHQLSKADAELRRSVRESVTRSLYTRLNEEGQADADRAIDRAFAALPLGTKRPKLEATCEQAVSPWRQAVAQRDEQDRRLAVRESVLMWADWKLPSDLPATEKAQALAALRRVFDQHLEAGREELEMLRDQTFGPYVEGHQRRKEAAASEQDHARRRSLAESRANVIVDVPAVYQTVAELDRKREIDHADFNENWALAERLVKRIRPALVTVLLANPHLSAEEIRRHVERLVDQHLDVCLAAG